MRLIGFIYSAGPALLWFGIQISDRSPNIGYAFGIAGVIFTGIGIGVLFREVNELKTKIKSNEENTN